MAFSLNKQLLNPTLYQKVQDFWLEGAPRGPIGPSQELQGRWFGVKRTVEERVSFDNLCNTNFSAAVNSLKPSLYPLPTTTSYSDEVAHSAAIAAPLYSEFSSDPLAALSFIILFDQLPRNMFRDDQKLPYFHFDVICRSLIRTMLANNYRPDLDPSIRFSISYRMWLYLPLMHSEYLEDHTLFEELFESLRKDTEEAANQYTKEFMAAFLAYERMHSDVLKMFGRYPYRNAHIGRESTKEELEFLAKGPVFGTQS